MREHQKQIINVIGPNGEIIGTTDGNIIPIQQPGFSIAWSFHYYYNLWIW